MPMTLRRKLATDGPPMTWIARQPILDHRGQVFGYELLCRGAIGSRTEPGDLGSARLFTDAVGVIGLDILTGGRPAFATFTRTLLLDGGSLLPPSSLVIQLHKDIEIDDAVVETCRALAGAGYALGVDSVADGPTIERLLPYVKFVRADVRDGLPSRWRSVASRQAPRGMRLIATSVDTPAVAEQARAVGYRLFQGRFFMHPTTLVARRIPETKIAHLQLLAMLTRDDTSIAELESIVKRDISLSYRVLRTINSSAFGLRRQIGSIREALILLGQDQIRKWASVWTLALMNDGRPPETIATALIRARACEQLAESVKGVRPGDFFLIGLCSALDAILDRPMADILEVLPLADSIKDTLLGRAGRMRSILDAALAYECGSWADAMTHLGKAGGEGARAADRVHSGAAVVARVPRPALRPKRTAGQHRDSPSPSPPAHAGSATTKRVPWPSALCT
jgi:EAL and modified HD-GYP domain-containing signal transduction protein